MTTPEFPTLDNGHEITCINDLRELYDNHRNGQAMIAERQTALAHDIETLTSDYDGAIGWLNSDDFDSATITNAATVQDVMADHAQKVKDAATAADAVQAALDKAHSGLEAHRNLEEAVASAPGGPAKSTSSYMPR